MHNSNTTRWNRELAHAMHEINVLEKLFSNCLQQFQWGLRCLHSQVEKYRNPYKYGKITEECITCFYTYIVV